MTSCDTVKVAVLGAGYWGKNLARNFAELAALAAIYDPDPETAAREAEKNKVPARSFEEVLADPAISAVAIAAPAEWHTELALRAFDAGKHVYVEKPLALSLDDGKRICDAAKSADRLLMVGHLLQYHPAFETLLAAVKNQEIGSLRYVYSNRLSLGKMRREENALWSFAPHDLSMILALFDEMPENVRGGGSAHITSGVEDEYRIDMTFSGGRRAHIFASWLHPFKEHRLVVVGETGMLVFEDSTPTPEEKLRLYRHKIDATAEGAPAITKAAPEPLPYPVAEPLKQECRHFLERCADGAAPRTDGREALAVLEVLIGAGDT